MGGKVVVMGVSGCGKSSLAAELARRCATPLIEGDDYHDAASRAKMRGGVALTDADRAGWLERLGRALADAPDGAVLSCSALKYAYRERLRAAVAGLRFIYLELGRDAALRRVGARAAHFFPATLVDSQFAALEPPCGEAGVLTLDATRALPELADEASAWLAAPRS